MLERLILALFVLILVSALLWVELSMKWPVIQKCREAGYSKVECADPTIRALVVTKAQ